MNLRLSIWKISFLRNFAILNDMLNRTSDYLQTLGNNIYIRKSSSTTIYLFKVNNRSTSERLSIVFIINFGHISYYWQMYKILVKQQLIRKGCDPKQLFQKKTSLKVTAFSSKELFFFRVQCFFVSQKQVRPFIPQLIGFFKKSNCSHELRKNVFDRI